MKSKMILTNYFVLDESCEVESESRIPCELTAKKTCPDFCCDDGQDCYERKGT